MFPELPATDYTVTFDLDSSPESIIIEDTTDYAAIGVALADVVGILKIVGPDASTVYENTSFLTPDIDMDVLRTFSVPAPLDSDGNPLIGNYRVEYSTQIIGATLPGDYTTTRNYSFCHEKVKACTELTYDCEKAQVTSKDVTDYGQYFTSAVYEHKVNAPVESGLGSVTLTTAIAIVGPPISTKTWSSVLNTTATYTYQDGLIVIQTSSAYSEVDVRCSDRKCEIYDCVKDHYDTYNALLLEKPSEAVKYREDTLTPVLTDLDVYNLAKACGDDATVQEIEDRLLGSCSCSDGGGCSCSCSGSSLVLIQVGGIEGDAVVIGPNTFNANALTDSGAFTINWTDGVPANFDVSWFIDRLTCDQDIPITFKSPNAAFSLQSNSNVSTKGAPPTVVQDKIEKSTSIALGQFDYDGTSLGAGTYSGDIIMDACGTERTIRVDIILS